MYSFFLNKPITVHGKTYPILPKEIEHEGMSGIEFLTRYPHNVPHVDNFQAFSSFTGEVLHWYDGPQRHLSPYSSIASYTLGYQIAASDTSPYSGDFQLVENCFTYSMYHDNLIYLSLNNTLFLGHDYSNHLNLRFAHLDVLKGIDVDTISELLGGRARHWAWLNTMVAYFDRLMENTFDVYNLKQEQSVKEQNYIQVIRKDFLLHLFNTNWDLYPTEFIKPPETNNVHHYVDFFKKITRELDYTQEEIGIIV